MSAKRRLPVLATASDDATPERPAWQWCVFGAGLIVLLWVTLALLATPAIAALAPSVATTLVVHAAVQALACMLVGSVVGTWGPRPAVRIGAAAGALSAVLAAGFGALAALSAAGSSVEVVSSLAGGAALVPSATAAAAVGAWLGGKRRRT